MRALSIVTFVGLFLGVAPAHAVTLSCAALFSTNAPVHAVHATRAIPIVETRDYRLLNPTAALSADEYHLPNGRKWRDYVRVFFDGFGQAQAGIQDGDTVLDIGGGQGRAMAELAAQRNIKAIVINTQDFSGRYPEKPGHGTLRYLSGWAEEVLQTIPGNSIGAAFDLFGAFHYSIRKDFLIESVYRVLKPGASAHFVFDFENSPASVDHVRFDTWLVQNWPGVFSTHKSQIGTRFVTIITMKKPTPRSFFGYSRAQKPLKLNLEVVDADMNPRNPFVPRVLFHSRQK